MEEGCVVGGGGGEMEECRIGGGRWRGSCVGEVGRWRQGYIDGGRWRGGCVGEGEMEGLCRCGGERWNGVCVGEEGGYRLERSMLQLGVGAE